METVRDISLVFQRHVYQALRNPVLMIIGLIQPILYLCLFAPLLIGFAGKPGFPQGDSLQIYVPGLLVQLGLFGTTFAGFGIISEWRMGLLERMRVTPVSRLALLLGRVLRDAFVLELQTLVLIIAAFAFGLRAPIAGVLASLILVGLLAITAASLSYAVALTVKSENAFAPILNITTIPLLLLSGILLPMSLAPSWLDTLSRLNPLRYLVEAIRELFLGNYFSDRVFLGAGLIAVLAVVAVAIGTRKFRLENA
ncbi:ABC transporter permease [Telmatocola sphagniphila]|uniref:Transport permease protein n=1 Tax=Telmatocola sphagniphila TaxID=1123043 RepID=A0A8E6BC60_9BACT|nr:ABC transporter permease [Telmatocola sphagniphila]QVL34175.1 ABC transporter permease [Telmatocola sphagniphila]